MFHRQSALREVEWQYSVETVGALLMLSHWVGGWVGGRITAGQWEVNAQSCICNPENFERRNTNHQFTKHSIERGDANIYSDADMRSLVSTSSMEKYSIDKA